MKAQHTFSEKVRDWRSKYISVIVSVVVSFLLVSMGVYGATTVSTNLSTGGTFSVGGLSTLYGGFLTASSTATSTFMVSGVFQASSTFLTGSSLTTFGSGGFITTASSTAVSTLRVNGVLSASSTFQSTGTTTVFSALVVGATSTPALGEVGIVGDISQGSITGTTTHLIDSSQSGKGGCIQLKGTDGRWFRIYATSSAGYAYLEVGGCLD